MHILRRYIEELKDTLNKNFKINYTTPLNFKSVTILEI